VKKIIINIVSYTFVLTFFISSLSISQINNVWTVTESHSSSMECDQISNHSCNDNYGNYYFTGHTTTADGRRNLFIAKCSEKGVLIWLKKYNFTNNTEGKFIKIDKLGNIVVVADCYNGGTYSGILFATFSCYGELLFKYVHSTSYLVKYYVDNYCNLSGVYRQGENHRIFKIINGIGLSFSKVVGIASSATIISINQDYNNNTYVLFSANNMFNINKYDIYGNNLWTKTYQASASAISTPAVLTADSANNIYVSGYNLENSQYSISNLKYSQDGTLLWDYSANLLNGKKLIPSKISLVYNGNILISGNALIDSSNTGNYVYKYDTAGYALDTIIYTSEQNSILIFSDFALDTLSNLLIYSKIKISGTETPVTIKFNQAGDFLWEKRYDEYSANNVKCGNLIIDEYNNASLIVSKNDLLTKYDASILIFNIENGNVVNKYTYSEKSGYIEEGKIIITGEDDNIYVLANASLSSNRTYLYKYNPNGVKIFEKMICSDNQGFRKSIVYNSITKKIYVGDYNGITRIDTSGNMQVIWSQSPYSITIDKAGHLYGVFTSSYNFVLTKFNSFSPNHDTLWTKCLYGYSTSYYNLRYSALDVIAANNGFIYCVAKYRYYGGYSVYFDYHKFTVATFDTTTDFRNPLYTDLIDLTDKNSVYSKFVVDSTGFNVYLLYSDDVTNYGGKIYIAKIVGGCLSWIRNYLGYGNSNGNPSDIILDKFHNVLVTGSNSSASKEDVVLLKYDPSGNLIFNRIYNGSSNDNDAGNKLFIDSTNNIYIAGYSSVPGGYKKSLILKYSSDGNLLWNYRFSFLEASDDWFNDLIIKNDRYLYVTGNAYLGEGVHKIITLKYDTYGGMLTENPSFNMNFLGQNYPNPFNPVTNIPFSISKSGTVKIELFDITGRLIKTITNQYYNKGNYILQCSFSDLNLSSGVYIYKINAADFCCSKHLIYIK